MVFSWLFIVFHGFFKELDFKELEIHRYPLMDTINECQWTTINEFIHWWTINDYHWWSINEYGPLSLVPFLWALLWGLSWSPFLGPSFSAFRLGPMGPPQKLWMCLRRPSTAPPVCLRIQSFGHPKKGLYRGPVGQKTEKPEIQKTLHKTGLGFKKMGFW